MHISYIIYIILNSRCYTGVRAPKLSHRSSYIKEPFGKGLDGLPGAGRGLQKGLKEACGAWDPFKVASRGLEKGFKGASRGLEKGLKVACLKGASSGLEKGFKGAWEGLEKGLKGASRWRGLQGGLKGAWEGLQGGFKGAWEGLQGGLRRASRGLQGGFKPFSPSCPPPSREGTLQAPLEGYLRRWWLGSSPPPPAQPRIQPQRSLKARITVLRRPARLSSQSLCMQPAQVRTAAKTEVMQSGAVSLLSRFGMRRDVSHSNYCLPNTLFIICALLECKQYMTLK